MYIHVCIMYIHVYNIMYIYIIYIYYRYTSMISPYCTGPDLPDLDLTPAAQQLLCVCADGDARVALNALELAAAMTATGERPLNNQWKLGLLRGFHAQICCVICFLVLAGCLENQGL